MARFRSYVNVERDGGEWIVVQYMTAEDAREVAAGLSTSDGARTELERAANDVDERNEEEARDA